MRRVIFCLLAFCVFKTVFADDANKFQQDLAKLHKKSCDQINTDTKKIQDKIADEVKAAEKNGINLGSEDDGCLGSSDVSIKTYVDRRIAMIDECCAKATCAQDIKVAKKCCSDTVAALKKELKLAAVSAKKCISNCTHHDCSEDE